MQILGGRGEIPRPPMIKTAGLSSLDPAKVEPERVSAAFNSAIIGLEFLTNGNEGCLQMQAMEM